MKELEKWEPAPGEQVAVRDRKDEPWNSREFLRKEKAELASPYQYICKFENGDSGMVGFPPSETGWQYIAKLPIMRDHSIAFDKVKKLPELETDPEHYKMPESSEFKLERIVPSKDSGGFADSMGVKYDFCKKHGVAEVQWYLHNSLTCPVCKRINQLLQEVNEPKQELKEIPADAAQKLFASAIVEGTIRRLVKPEALK